VLGRLDGCKQIEGTRSGDPTPIICEITPRTERSLYREGIRIQSLTGFFRLQDKTFQPTRHKAQKIRVTGYLMWDDDHNGSADVGSTIEYPRYFPNALTRARVMALVRRSPRPPGMPDAFGRARLR
jgi:hypothetical protein